MRPHARARVQREAAREGLARCYARGESALGELPVARRPGHKGAANEGGPQWGRGSSVRGAPAGRAARVLTASPAGPAPALYSPARVSGSQDHSRVAVC